MTRANDDWHPAAAWVDAVINELVPKVEDCRYFLALAPSDGGEGDVKFWVELGLAIMLDKPIVAIVPVAEHEKFKLPRKLRIVADQLVFAPDGLNQETAVELKAALGRMGMKVQ